MYPPGALCRAVFFSPVCGGVPRAGLVIYVRGLMKKILFLGTSSGTRDMIEYSRARGYHTIVTDNIAVENSPVKAMADEQWPVSTADVDTLERMCREHGVDGVACGAADFNVSRHIELCGRLGLPCYTDGPTWQYSMDKAAFKRECRRMEVPVAEDFFLSNPPSGEQLGTVRYPVVVKPVDMSGNKGVSYCHTEAELLEAMALVREVSRNPNVIVERMLRGEEWYASYILADGEISLLALNAMYAEKGRPANCYTLTTTVSDKVERFIADINPKIEGLLRHLGCREGYAWVQVMLDEDGRFYVIEMGYRLDGDMMFDTCREMNGIDVAEWLVELALGNKKTAADLPAPQTAAFKRCACAFMLWTEGEGRVTEIRGLDEMAAVPGVKVEPHVRVGDTLRKYGAYGNIIFTTDTIDGMCDMLRAINRKVAVINDRGEDVVIKYTDFDYLKKVYKEGLEGK